MNWKYNKLWNGKEHSRTISKYQVEVATFGAPFGMHHQTSGNDEARFRIFDAVSKELTILRLHVAYLEDRVEVQNEEIRDLEAKLDLKSHYEGQKSSSIF